MSNFKFHPRCGKLVTIFDDGRCAARGSPTQEFNDGLVFSNTTLPDDKVFEIKITKIISSWTGSFKIGITTQDPDAVDVIPSSSPELLNDTWLMSGCSVLSNGRPIIQSYGVDLDNLEEGDRIGVMITREGDLVFYINSCAQGIAASDIPKPVYVVLDLYGKCSQIAIVTDREQAGSCFFAPLTNDSNQVQEASTSQGPKARDKLRFHVRCGSLVKLSANRRTAERRKPLDEFNNGIVMTHRPLKDDELFEIRIDRLVDKWSGSIEVGVTTHDPSTLDFPATMTNLRSGTIMMSGCGILTNGRGIRHEYGHVNLDELKEGDRIGMVRKSNGELHYYINGSDQGVASNKVPLRVWGVVDLYGMTVRVTIVDSDSRDERNLTLRRNTSMAFLDMQSSGADELLLDDPLLFHTNCGLHAAVVNGGKTAHRPHASEDFNHGVVLTSRTLRPNEIFEVVIDQIVQKWAGSIEIGVTTHSPVDLEYPATMTNVRSGTYIMTGNGVMHNGTTIIDDYGQNLDQLKNGDRVGVLRTPSGVLHFFVNGVDQGAAASNVPPNVYGVIDLYGQAAQATILDRCALTIGEEGCDTPGSVTTSLSASTMYQPSPGDLIHTDLCFHQLHGRKARVLNNGITACRPHAVGEFNDAIVITNRPLHDGEIFEIVLEKMVERWSGSIEAGVTLIRPEELDFPSTLTDIDYDTWMLSGSTVMRDGELVRNGYPCDLDTLPVGTRLGMSRNADGSLHYYVNGRDQGAALDFVPPNVYAIIDLYGQCAQVSLNHIPLRRPGLPLIKGSLIRPELNMDSTSPHKFSTVCGSSITLKDHVTMAQRGNDFRHALVFGSRQLSKDEAFEVRIESRHPQYAGSLSFGYTTREPSESQPSETRKGPLSLSEIDAWYVRSFSLYHNGNTEQKFTSPCFERLCAEDRITMKRCASGVVTFQVNSIDLGVSAPTQQCPIYPFIELNGGVDCIRIVSSCNAPYQVISPMAESFSMGSLSANLPASLVQEVNKNTDPGDSLPPRPCEQGFSEIRGRNICLSNGGLIAMRTASYNQGVVLSRAPLVRGEKFEVKIDKLTKRWNSSIMVGLVCQPTEKNPLPVSALSFRRNSWIVAGKTLFVNGHIAKSHLPFNLDNLEAESTVGIFHSEDGDFHVVVNGNDFGKLASEIEEPCYAIVDLYGQCEEVQLIVGDHSSDNYDEKADLDCVVKEKERHNAALVAASVSATPVQKCAYKQLCKQFRLFTGIPDTYFISEMTCFCAECFKVRTQLSETEKNSKESNLVGWCRFQLAPPRPREGTPTGVESHDRWHCAYYPVDASHVRQIIDAGQVYPVDRLGLCRPKACSVNDSKTEETETSRLVFYPSMPSTIAKAGVPFRYKKNLYCCHLAFQLLVQPGSYKVSEHRKLEASSSRRSPTGEAVDYVEWSTKEKGATVLQALLVKIE